MQNLQDTVMRTILFLRHAQAVLPDSTGKDFDRSLSKAGRSDAEKQAERILKAGIKPDFILCSPAKRTLQTAEIFSAAINGAFPEDTIAPHAAASLYRAGATGYIHEIRTQVPATSQCALIVGHNPSIEDCTLLFAQSNSQFTQRVGYGFPTAGLARIETDGLFSEFSPENAQLTALYLPHED